MLAGTRRPTASIEFGGRSVDWSTRKIPYQVTSLDQVHGRQVVRVDFPGHETGTRADAAVTASPGAQLLIRTADCAPVAFVGRNIGGDVVGVGAAHAGWRGLVSGILPETVTALRSLGAERISASLGPCIGVECYEFGQPEIELLSGSLGSAVVGRAANGSLALDLVAAVRHSLHTVDVDVDTSAWSCTACDGQRFFSFRARRESGRQGLIVSLDVHGAADIGLAGSS